MKANPTLIIYVNKLTYYLVALVRRRVCMLWETSQTNAQEVNKKSINYMVMVNSKIVERNRIGMKINAETITTMKIQQ